MSPAVPHARALPAAAIGNADDAGAPLVVQPFEEQVGIGARPKGSVIERVRLRLRQRLGLDGREQQ